MNASQAPATPSPAVARSIADISAFDRYQKARFFPALDGLRCVSILGVISFHAGVPYRTFFGQYGGLGVQFFFVISGFLITTLLLRERRDTNDVSLTKFYLRRTLRIFPLYYSVLAIYCIATLGHDRGTREGQEFFHRLPIFITYTSNWFILNGQGHFALSWSLATEEQFYLFWPAIVTFLSRKPWVPLASILAIAAADLALEISFNSGLIHASPVSAQILTSISTPICFGCVLAYLLHWKKSFDVIYPIVSHPISALVALAVAMTMSLFTPTGNANAFTLFITAMAIVGCVIVATCVVGTGGILKPILTNKAVRHIGVISYGMYLIHQLCLKSTDKLVDRFLPTVGGPMMGPMMHFFIGTSVTILIASLSYHYYESIFLRLKERWAKRPEKPATLLSPAAPAHEPVAGEPA